MHTGAVLEEVHRPAVAKPTSYVRELHGVGLALAPATGAMDAVWCRCDTWPAEEAGAGPVDQLANKALALVPGFRIWRCRGSGSIRFVLGGRRLRPADDFFSLSLATVLYSPSHGVYCGRDPSRLGPSTWDTAELVCLPEEAAESIAEIIACAFSLLSTFVHTMLFPLSARISASARGRGLRIRRFSNLTPGALY